MFAKQHLVVWRISTFCAFHPGLAEEAEECEQLRAELSEVQSHCARLPAQNQLLQHKLERDTRELQLQESGVHPVSTSSHAWQSCFSIGGPHAVCLMLQLLRTRSHSGKASCKLSDRRWTSTENALACTSEKAQVMLLSLQSSCLPGRTPGDSH